jgi:hypothetical protein
MHDLPRANAQRRTFLLKVASTLAVLPLAACQAYESPFNPKLSKAQAFYRDGPNGAQRCGNCVNFLPPGRCRIVEGPIHPDHWCRLWAVAA